jgi:hypothetical protein
MHWIDVFLYAFATLVIILIARGAFKAFLDFYRGKHHEKQEGQ